ncbi:TonB-dependent receptor [Pararhodonellum marinum]|uniref:TonB-dependent receptor n=1 Tax=Pararhodonellum marinum TaxID=2755358 RepID=UPI00293BB631|nr:TonB-dependent receptor [Pararhodonellum marinum]
MRMKLSVFFLVLGILIKIPPVFGQQTMVTGVVIERESGLPLPGANVFWEANREKGTVTDVDGRFSLSPELGLPQNLSITYLGFETIIRSIGPKDLNKELRFFLSAEAMSLDEIVISERSPDQNVKSMEIGKDKLPIATLKTIPALFGEVDLLRGLQLLPGVQSAGEGTTGLFVRGGSADQNLLQIDGAPVYNPSHFFGFFSVFNSDALENVDLYKGNIPAQYGGRLSSLIDVTFKEGNTEKLRGEGGIGTISSRLSLDGPLSDNSSYFLSARRTYADVFLRLSGDEDLNQNNLYFYDLSSKFMFRPSEKDKITFSTYFGRDFLGLSEQFGFGWQNFVNSLVWKRNINDRTYLDVSAYHSRYKYDLRFDDEDTGFRWDNTLSETGIRGELILMPRENLRINTGIHSQLYHFAAIDFRPDPNSAIEPIESNPRTGFQNNFFVAATFDLNSKTSMEAGLRLGLYQQIGRGIDYIYENDNPEPGGPILDTLSFNRFQTMKFYQGLEPRIALRYLFREDFSFKAAYNRNFQYVQVATNSSAGLPIDRWVPAGTYIKPIRSDQFSAGLFKNFQNNLWELSVEGYYKDFRNLIDLRQGANMLFTDNLETEILTGDGWAYGAEFLLRRNLGKTTGWLSYTYSRVFRKIEGISEGLPYNPRFDRPHDVAVVVTHEFNKRLSASVNFIYTTGVAVTFPKGTYEVDNQKLPVYGPLRNEDRFPDYHRMDASVNLKNREKGRKWKGSWNLSVYNLYGRKNPFSFQFTDILNDQINFDQSAGIPVESRRPGVVMTYLFSIVPAVSYNFTF